MDAIEIVVRVQVVATAGAGSNQCSSAGLHHVAHVRSSLAKHNVVCPKPFQDMDDKDVKSAPRGYRQSLRARDRILNQFAAQSVVGTREAAVQVNAVLDNDTVLNEMNAAYDELLNMYASLCFNDSVVATTQTEHCVNAENGMQTSNEGHADTCEAFTFTERTLPPEPFSLPPSPLSSATPPNQRMTSSWHLNLGEFMPQSLVKDDWSNWDLHL